MAGLTREEGFRPFDFKTGQDGSELGRQWLIKYVTEHKGCSVPELSNKLFGEFDKLSDKEKKSTKNGKKQELASIMIVIFMNQVFIRLLSLFMIQKLILRDGSLVKLILGNN